MPSHHMTPLIGIGTGNSGGFPGLPVCVPRKTRGHTTRARVFLQNRMKNLATAVQVSIDTAMRHLEVCNSVARVQSFESPWPCPSFTARRVVVGGLEGVLLHACVFTWGRVRGSRRCRHRVQVIAVVEPALLGSVSNRRGDWMPIHVRCFHGSLLAFVLMVVVGWHFPIRFVMDMGGASVVDKPTLPIVGDDSVGTHRQSIALWPRILQCR